MYIGPTKIAFSVRVVVGSYAAVSDWNLNKTSG